jgi:leucyl/phenylalanyl-tRNA--protein transferase
MYPPLYCVSSRRLTNQFPSVDEALDCPDGLLAAGGDLSTPRLLDAYRRGIFPWYEEGQPILWWSPDPRTVIFPEQFKVPRSLRKTLRSGRFEFTYDRDFAAVIQACAEPRRHQQGTWLTQAMMTAYCRLHEEGHAHSVECWHEGRLVGGLYGVAIGRVFFGESMFSRASDASKACLARLVQHLLDCEYRLVDCQVHSEHLERLGAIRIPRSDFSEMLERWCAEAPSPKAWSTSL